MDVQATLPISLPQSELGLASGPFADPEPRTLAGLWPAQQLQPQQRQELALAILTDTETASELSRQHHVSRKFLARQADTAKAALDQAFDPPRPQDDVLFYLPVTKAWIEQLALGLVLICHSSYRGVVELLGDLFDYPIALGTVHNIVQSAIPGAQRWNQQYDLSTIDVGAHDEIFQAGAPVFVGVDTATTFCYLLSLEEHCDAETWGVRLLELVDRGFAPKATIADGGKAFRAGQVLAMPKTPCWADLFHPLYEGKEILRFLQRSAYKAIDACTPRPPQKLGRPRRQQALSAEDQKHAEAECDAAVQLYDDMTVLLEWLRRDVLAVAGPSADERAQLYDFVLAELKARVPSCPHQLQPLWRTLKSHRDELLAWSQSLDEKLNGLAEEHAVAPEVLRRMLVTSCRDDRDGRRWTEEQGLRQELRGRFAGVWEAVSALPRKTIRASSLAENLNSRLRSYFFLRRQLGSDYLSLLQFFLNHRPLQRSEHPDRVGRTPAELLTGQPHLHWLSLLGYTRFARR